MEGNLQALFLFSDEIRKRQTVNKPRQGLQLNYGGITMSNENKQQKPNCPLIGEDGNIFNLVGLAARTLNALSANAENAETVCRRKRPR